MEWFINNAATIILTLILLFLAALVIRHLYKVRKMGGCPGCSCGCGGQCGRDESASSCWHSVKQKK